MYTLQSAVIGLPQINYALGPDSTQRVALGSIVAGTDPYFGGAEFVYLQAGDDIALGNVVIVNASKALLAPNVGYSGRSLAVAPLDFAKDQFGWFQISGHVPIVCTTALEADGPFGLSGSGTVGLGGAGLQVLSGVVVLAPGAAVVKPNVRTRKGNQELEVSNVEGWFPGIALSGDGIAAGSLLRSINGDGTVTASLPATDDGVVSVTGTYRSYIIGQINRPIVQGGAG